MALTLTACAGVPKVALRADAKQSVKRVALVERAEPTSYFLYPGPLPGGATLYIFGALGGAILGGIEANRQEVATGRFTAAVAPLEPALNRLLLARLETGLKEKGYDVTRVSEPPKTADGKDYDFGKIDSGYDAVLVTTLNAGYWVESSSVVPRVMVGATLHAKSGTEKLFADAYAYSNSKLGDATRVEPDARFTMQSVDLMYENVATAVEGLREGTRQLAERILLDL